MAANRRTERRSPHELAVHLTDGALQVRCACGRPLGGQRQEDPFMVTLGDLLELVRLHSNEINYPKD